MTPARQGSFRLFRFSGVTVYLHWLWLVFAFYSVSERVPRYHSPLWAVLEYLSLFLIVLLHEFGHSLACRSVGGRADEIVLWPLGGVAFVDPPPRPGAYLWSIAAGPLVNVILLPILLIALFILSRAGFRISHPDAYAFTTIVTVINAVLLGFNLLPIYPLDGGQILRALLWYPLGRARSQLIASIIGFVGIGLLALWAGTRYIRSPRDLIWDAVLALFLASNCWRGFVQARALRRLELLPRRSDFACPNCHAAPPIGDFWLCAQCRKPFDMFASRAVCPNCQTSHEVIRCPDCGKAKPLAAWDPAVRDL